MLRAGLLAVSLALFGGALSGAAAQPSLLKDVNPDPVDPLRYPPSLVDFTSVGPRAVFLLNRNEENSVGSELWTTDGTDAGTERLRSFLSSGSLINGFQATIAGSNGRIAFVFVTPGPSYPPPGPVSSLWRTDGTAAGTFPLARMLTSFGSSAIHAGSLFFAGCTTAADCEPWVSDGTVGGTRRLRDITPGEYGSDPREFVSVGNLLYFFADAPDGPGLWQTDGTRQGTRRVALLPVYSTPGNLAAVGSRLFFTVGPDVFPDSKKSLWTSDGTAGGTRSLPPFDLPRGRGPAVSRLLGAVGGVEYFGGVDPVLGLQLYRTDGTPGGTRRLTSFPRSQGAQSDGTALSDRLLFVGPGGKLWTSGGTLASTAPLAGCTGGCPVPYLDNGGLDRVVNGGLVFFSGSVGNDVEPWVTDGTPGGTRRLLHICRDGSCGSYPELGPVIRGQILFVAAGDLWGTDGTAAGPGSWGKGLCSSRRRASRSPRRGPAWCSPALTRATAPWTSSRASRGRWRASMPSTSG